MHVKEPTSLLAKSREKSRWSGQKVQTASYIRVVRPTGHSYKVKLFTTLADQEMAKSLIIIIIIIIGLRINVVVRNVPVADHKRVQSNGLYPQHGGVMTSMHKDRSIVSFFSILNIMSLIFVLPATTSANIFQTTTVYRFMGLTPGVEYTILVTGEGRESNATQRTCKNCRDATYISGIFLNSGS